MKPFPDVILLDRPLRAISLSLLQLGTIPGRTMSGRNWYLDPFQKGNLLCWPNQERLTDYQCCFAYCLEIEERKKVIAATVRKAGTKLARTSARQLSTWRGLFHFSRDLGLPFPRLKSLYSYAFLKRHKINHQTSGKTLFKLDSCQLDDEEKEMLHVANRSC